jgi:hypothetical protein
MARELIPAEVRNIDDEGPELQESSLVPESDYIRKGCFIDKIGNLS